MTSFAPVNNLPRKKKKKKKRWEDAQTRDWNVLYEILSASAFRFAYLGRLRKRAVRVRDVTQPPTTIPEVSGARTQEAQISSVAVFYRADRADCYPRPNVIGEGKCGLGFVVSVVSFLGDGDEPSA